MKFKNIVIMKYGVHAQEDVYNIIQRKKEEYKKCGKIFWGYNGVLCNPKTQIQPFLNENRNREEETFLLLVRTFSDNNGEGYCGKEFSYDRDLWMTLPEGIKVVGSKYAVVCDDLVECDIQINLNDYAIAVGNSRQKPLNDYLKGRVDKACASLKTKDDKNIENNVCVSFYSRVLDAVFIR